ncbi:MAG: T9SS type A sorting domain-containing protein [Salinibacter sp.]
MNHALHILRCGLLFCLVGLAPVPGLAQVEWTGDGGDNRWTTPENWSSERVPSDTDDVAITVTGTDSVMLDDEADVQSLVLGCSGEDCTGTQVLYGDPDDNAYNNNLTVREDSEIRDSGHLDWPLENDNIVVDGSLVVHGQLTWGGGDIEGSDTLRVAEEGLLKKTGGETKFLEALLENKGTVVWEDGYWSGFDGRMLNQEGGTIRVEVDNADDTDVLNVDSLFNAGTIVRDGGDAVKMRVDHEHTGTVHAQHGSIVVGPAANYSVTSQGGTYEADQGGTIRFDYATDGSNIELDEDTEFRGTGTFYFDGSESRDADFNSVSNPATFDTEGTVQFFGSMEFLLDGTLKQVGDSLRLETAGGDEQPHVYLQDDSHGPLSFEDIHFTGSGNQVTLGTEVDLLTNDLTMWSSFPVLEGDANVTVMDTLDWNRGMMQGSGQTRVEGHARLRTDYKRLRRDLVVEEGATGAWSEGLFDIEEDEDGSVGRLLNRGTFEIQTDEDLRKDGVLENEGLLTKSDSTTTVVRPHILNADTLRLAAGTLELDKALQQTGTGVLEGGATLDVTAFDSELVGSGVISPGTPEAPIDELEIVGDVSFSGFIDIDVKEVASREDYDVVDVEGEAKISGSVFRPRLQEGFAPQEGDEMLAFSYEETDPSPQTDVEAPSGFRMRSDEENVLGTNVQVLTVQGVLSDPLQGGRTVLTHSDVSHLGHATALGDFDGDGYDDLAVASVKDPLVDGLSSSDLEAEIEDRFVTPTVDTVFVLFNVGTLGEAAVSDPVSLKDEADLRLHGTEETPFKGGHGMLHTADYDGDGADGLFVGGEGAVHVFSADTLSAAVGTIASEDATHTLSVPGEGTPNDLETGDLDGDGAIDLVVGAPQASTNGHAENGAVAFFYGDDTGDAYFNEDADGQYAGQEDNEHLGHALSGGDVDDDGTLDLSVVAGGHLDPNGIEDSRSIWCLDADDFYDDLVEQSNPGAAYLLYGPLTGASGDVASDADVTVDGEFGTEVAPPVYENTAAYAPLARTLLADRNDDGQAEWHLGRAVDRVQWKRFMEARNESPLDGTSCAYTVLDAPWNLRGLSERVTFEPDQVPPGSSPTLDDGTRDAAHGRSLHAATFPQSDSTSLLQGDDVGGLSFVATSERITIQDDRLINSDAETDGGTVRSNSVYIDPPESSSPWVRADDYSALGASVDVGNVEQDDIDDLAVGAPFYVPESTEDPNGALVLRRSGDRVINVVVEVPVDTPEVVPLPGQDLLVDFGALESPTDLEVERRPDQETEDLDLPDDQALALPGTWELDLEDEPEFEADACFDLEDVFNNVDPELMSIYKRASEGDPWTHVDVGLRDDDDDGTADRVCGEALSAFSEFAVTADSSEIPVELAGVEAATGEESVRIEWQTAAEENNAGFAVERRAVEGSDETSGEASGGGSGDEGDWTELGFVESAAEGGTTDRPQAYRFVDEDLPYEADRLAYRLRQVDTDGSATLSAPVVIEVGAPEELALHAPAPHPVQEQARLRYEVPEEGPVRVELYDVLGRKVSTLVDREEEAGRKQVSLNASGLSSGTYFVRLEAEGAVRTEQITVVR